MSLTDRLWGSTSSTTFPSLGQRRRTDGVPPPPTWFRYVRDHHSQRLSTWRERDEGRGEAVGSGNFVGGEDRRLWGRGGFRASESRTCREGVCVYY